MKKLEHMGSFWLTVVFLMMLAGEVVQAQNAELLNRVISGALVARNEKMLRIPDRVKIKEDEQSAVNLTKKLIKTMVKNEVKMDPKMAREFTGMISRLYIPAKEAGLAEKQKGFLALQENRKVEIIDHSVGRFAQALKREGVVSPDRLIQRAALLKQLKKTCRWWPFCFGG